VSKLQAPRHPRVDRDLPSAERLRLGRVHELLLLAGPPSEVPVSLLEPLELPPDRLQARVLRLVPLQQRRARGRIARVCAVAATAAAVVALSADQLTATEGTPAFTAATVVRMYGTAADPLASATISLGSHDAAGNWPMRLSVRHLRPLARGNYYELYLTKNGHPLASCGTFNVARDTTVVRLNAPYDLDEYNGWMIARQKPGHTPSSALLTTTAL
jgi:hypothetical protein